LLSLSTISASQYCPSRIANLFLAGARIFPSDRYRNVGVISANFGFNAVAANSCTVSCRSGGFPSSSLQVFHRDSKSASSPSKHKHEAETSQQQQKHDEVQEDEEGKSRWGKISLHFHIAMGGFDF
jgi:hypothetical protein